MDYYIYENTPIFSCTLKEMHGKDDMLCHHYHSGYEIFFMLDGDRYTFVNNGLRHLTRGDVIILRPYVLHYNVSRESDYFKRYALDFSKEIFDSILTEKECDALLSGLHTGMVHLDEHYIQIFTALFEHISHSGHKKSTLNMKRLGAKLITLIDFLKEAMADGEKQNNEAIIVSDNFAAALNYINSHFTDKLTLDFICEYTHMSKPHFCRVFKNETKTTFLQYVNSLRVAYAHNLLVETNRAVQEIAEKAGFSSVLHFERVFKETHGISPSAMRKQNK